MDSTPKMSVPTGRPNVAEIDTQKLKRGRWPVLGCAFIIFAVLGLEVVFSHSWVFRSILGGMIFFWFLLRWWESRPEARGPIREMRAMLKTDHRIKAIVVYFEASCWVPDSPYWWLVFYDGEYGVAWKRVLKKSTGEGKPAYGEDLPEVPLAPGLFSQVEALLDRSGFWNVRKVPLIGHDIIGGEREGIAFVDRLRKHVVTLDDSPDPRSPLVDVFRFVKARLHALELDRDVLRPLADESREVEGVG